MLVTLCVSDNVGPRLLPLPLAPEPVSAPALYGGVQTASRTPSQRGTTGARVQMISARQGWVGDERQSPHVAAHAPKFDLAVPPVPRSQGWELYPPSAESSARFSRPKGRAPPRLV